MSKERRLKAFIHYKNYALLRQALIRNPASLSSLFDINNVNDSFQSLETAIEKMNHASRTIMITELPEFIMDD